VLISLNWIRDFVDLPADLDPMEVMNRITMRTAEVDGVERLWKHLPQVVTARVVELKPHPDANKLKLARVNDGLGEMEVVCGAPNIAVGQIVALAKAGADLPAGKLQANTIRGVRSEGMICAEDELGLSDNHEGVLVFPEGTKIGQTLDKLYGQPDIVLEIDNKSLTHRPDLWGHVGFAREFAACYDRPFKWEIDPSIIKCKEPSDPLQVENQARDLCPRYSALVVDNVFVAPSPQWMQQRLRAVGLRPINNLVDVTNFVMLQLGQPMHAFDRRQISGDRIIIRRAQHGEIFTTLDEQKHELISDDIVISDATRAVALGGVMGGLNSEVVSDTTCIVLESANFHASNIRRTATRLDLRTESAQRFEKSQDPSNTFPSIIRAVELIKLTCPDARVASAFLDDWQSPPQPIDIIIDFGFIHARLGEVLEEERIIGILRSLQFGVKRIGETSLEIRVPSYRATKDISIRADIVEEIGRIFGYDNITPVAPLVPSDPPEQNSQRQFEWLTRDIFCSRLGFDEVSNYSFVSSEMLSLCGFDPQAALKLRNPISKDLDSMRTTLVPHIVQNVATNQKHLERFRLFEIGRASIKVDVNSPELASENRRLCGAIGDEDEKAFFAAKGAVADFIGLVHLVDTESAVPQSPPAWAHPGRVLEYSCEGVILGTVAELHPRIADQLELRRRVAIFDFDFDALFDSKRRKVAFKPLRRFPVNPIEITVVVPKRRSVGDIEAVIRKAGGNLLISQDYLYTYEGKPLSDEEKAVTYHVVFGADDRTLGGEEVAALHEGLVEALNQAGMPLRGAERGHV
jgi:phenylalanyl-tRNA synthetase beta chain